MLFGDCVILAIFKIDDHSNEIKNNDTNLAKHTCHSHDVIINGAGVSKCSW